MQQRYGNKLAIDRGLDPVDKQKDCTIVKQKLTSEKNFENNLSQNNISSDSDSKLTIFLIWFLLSRYIEF